LCASPVNVLSSCGPVDGEQVVYVGVVPVVTRHRPAQSTTAEPSSAPVSWMEAIIPRLRRRAQPRAGPNHAPALAEPPLSIYDELDFVLPRQQLHRRGKLRAHTGRPPRRRDGSERLFVESENAEEYRVASRVFSRKVECAVKLVHGRRGGERKGATRTVCSPLKV
jgi:hypothetical protein